MIRETATDYPATNQEPPDAYYQFAKDVLEERRQATAAARLLWQQNIRFLGGDQWLAHDGKEFVGPSGPSYQKFPVRNMLLPYARVVMAKLTKNRPVVRCMPGSMDNRDLQAAKLGDDIIHAKWVGLDVSQRLREVVSWVITTGNAWLMPYWNKDTGVIKPLTAQVDVPELGPDGTPAVDETGEIKMRLIDVPLNENGEPVQNGPTYDMNAKPAYVDEGDIALRVLGPHEVFPNVEARTEADIDSVVMVELVSVATVHRRWPFTRGKVDFDDDATGGFADLRMNFTPSPLSMSPSDEGMMPSLVSNPFGHGSERLRSQQVMVVYYYERPSPTWPKGRYWATCNGELLEGPADLPNNGLWPVVFLIKDWEVAGQLLGDSVMSAAIGPQRDYNRENKVIQEYENLFLNPKWTNPMGSGIQSTEMTTQPGEVIQHPPGLKPEMADIKPLPAQVYTEREAIKREMETIVGVHRASAGEAPSGIRSGRALLTLQEADDSDLGPVTERIEMAYSKVAMSWLRMMQLHYTTDRMLHFSGTNRSYRVRSFKGADLSTVAQVEPVIGSAFPFSKTAKQGFVIEIAEAIPQLFMDPDTGMPDAERLRRALPVGGEEAVDQSADPDFAEAHREHALLEGWGDPGRNPLYADHHQNDRVHIREHANYMKDANFMDLPEWKRMFMAAHLHAHQLALAIRLGAQLPGAALGAGTTGALPAPVTENFGSEGMPPDQGAALHDTEVRSTATKE